MITSRRRMVPAGLLATLLVALCLLLAPSSVQRVEVALRWLQCLPLRWLQSGQVEAAVSVADQTELVTALQSRQRRAALAGGLERVPGDLEPVPLMAVAIQHKGGRPTELLLATRAEDLVGCLSFVTYGDALVGFLATNASGQVVVRLLQHRGGGRPRRVPARVDLEGRPPLRLVVEPAAAIDPWPLRCTCLQDPYAADAQLRARPEVRTEQLPDDPLGQLPKDLLVGHVEVWGYAAAQLVVGLYVRPAHAAESLAMVVAWRPRRASAEPIRSDLLISRVPAAMLSVPSRAGSRWYATADADFVVGAAIVRGQTLLGVVQSGGFGEGFLAPLGSDGLRSFLLMPDDPALPVQGLTGELVNRAGELFLKLPDPQALPAGILFSGVSSWHCPAGLILGRIELVTAGWHALSIDGALTDGPAELLVVTERVP